MSMAPELRQTQGATVNTSTKSTAPARLPTHKTIQMTYGLPPRGKVVQTSLWGMIPMKQNNTQDNEIFGHDMETIDNVNTVRVLLQNPNGIHPHTDNKELEASLRTCHSQCISILGLSETNVDWNRHTFFEGMRESIKKHWDGSVIQPSTSTEKFKEGYKPGGTLTAVLGAHWAAKIINKGTDPTGMGRWSFITMKGVGDILVTFVTAYRVCITTKEASGEKTAFQQQHRIWQSRYPTRPNDPRKQFILDLQLWISQMKDLGHDIVLMMDANEDITTKPGVICAVTPIDP